MLDYAQLVHVFVTLISILNPLGIIPIFLAVTADEDPQQKKVTIKKTVTAVALILLLSAFGGTYLLDFFGIDIDSFRIAGGILLLLMAIHMLQARTPTVKTNTYEHNEAVEKEDVSVVPLAIPLLAGPGAISTVILFSTSMPHFVDKISLGVIILFVVLLIWPILLLSEPIGERLGRTGLNIATRIMGLILAAIAVRFMLEGLLHFFKGNI
ncbi:MAG: NAAT family transporter [Helicobacteraceae bacterium]|jgi:multiple antibiotic resistance protein|nr:NAAT family transporter [Helicobacteraceae bacterium]